MRDIRQTFLEKIYECNQHKKRLQSAKEKLKDIMPLNVKQYEKLDDIFISVIDQFIFRFSKIL